MSSYKLTYFNITGLGEPIRFLLHQSGIKFDDNRLTHEEWVQVKPKTPLGQLPLLEIDGKIYYQSQAIGRLIAKRNNLAGSNDEEAYHADVIVDSIADLKLSLIQYHFEENPKTKEILKKKAFEKLPLILGKLEEEVKKNGGHFVNGKLTWADLWYAANTDVLSNVLQRDLNQDHPELKKLVEKVRALPNIKAYLDKRPKTAF